MVPSTGVLRLGLHISPAAQAVEWCNGALVQGSRWRWLAAFAQMSGTGHWIHNPARSVDVVWSLVRGWFADFKAGIRGFPSVYDRREIVSAEAKTSGPG